MTPRRPRHRRLLPTASSLLPVLLLTLLLLLLTPSPTQARMHASERRHLREQARAMFYHGYDNYMTHAYPWDELQPLSCSGRRWDRRARGDLDDVLGGYALTLIDSLDMLAIVGNHSEFRRAVRLVAAHTHFDRDVTVSVFEATIRVVGGLLSAHVLASPDHVGIFARGDYHDELLHLATALATRLLPAFATPTQLPVHRVNLRHGLKDKRTGMVRSDVPRITCPAAAGSLLVELAYLSRLSGNPIFEQKARAAVDAIWARRSALNLLGSSIDVVSGDWVSAYGGIGAGTDSFFEYLLKYHLLTGDAQWLARFQASYSALEQHANQDDLHILVDMHQGRRGVRARRVSALQAFWPGLQVLAGDVSSAIRGHDQLFQLWHRFGAMPELVDLTVMEQSSGGADGGGGSGGGDGGVISWARASPLRPELLESTYHLFQATRDHKYLKRGRKMLQDMERVSRVPCGYAAVGDIHSLQVEDRMDSYFLAETVKYLYLLFADDPDEIVPPMPVVTNITHESNTNSSCNANADNANANANGTCTVMYSRAVKSSEVVFSTEGHLFHIHAARNGSTNTTSSSLSASSTTYTCENTHANGYDTTTINEPNDANDTNDDDVQPAKATDLVTPLGISVRAGRKSDSQEVHVRTMVASPAQFGPRVDHVEAPLQLWSAQVGNACHPIQVLNADSEGQEEDGTTTRAMIPLPLAGRVVMVTRGGCSFAEKALHVQLAGGRGVVVINSRKAKKAKTSKATAHERQYVIADDALGLGELVTIPVAMVSREDAVALRRDVTALQEEAEGGAGKDPELTVSLSAWLH